MESEGRNGAKNTGRVAGQLIWYFHVGADVANTNLPTRTYLRSPLPKYHVRLSFDEAVATCMTFPGVTFLTGQIPG